VFLPGIGTGVKEAGLLGLVGVVGVVGVEALAASHAFFVSDKDWYSVLIFTSLSPAWTALWGEEPA
jgi:hypothetical protein